MRDYRWLALFPLVLALSFGSLAGASVQASFPSKNPPIQMPADDSDPQRRGLPHLDKQGPDEKQEKEMEKERRKQRWKDIQKDSEKLLEVATELKQYVDKSGENVMSLEVIKKAEEMEKLSKALQKKMKGE